MAELFGLVVPWRGRQSQHLAHERVVIGHVFQAIPVGVEAEAHAAQHEDLPEVHAGAAGGFFAGEDFGFQPGEELSLERGVPPDPLESRQNGRQFVPALERQANLFDGDYLEVWLGLEVVAQGGECCGFRHRNPSNRSNVIPTFAPSHTHKTQQRQSLSAFSSKH